MVRSPSSWSPVIDGALSARAGCCSPSRSPGTRAWVAKAMTRRSERSMLFTTFSDALAPKKTSARGSALSESAIPLISSAVSGSRMRFSSWEVITSLLSRFFCATIRIPRSLIFPPRLASIMGLSVWELFASCCCSTLNKGSPKPIKAFLAGSPGGTERRVSRVEADGILETVVFRISQSISSYSSKSMLLLLRNFPGFVGRMEKGRAPKGPSATTIRFCTLLILFSTGCNRAV